MTDPMRYYRPQFEWWRKLSTIRIWEIAFLMHDFEPRLADHIMQRDPENPDDPHGIPLDTSDEVRMLVSAMHAKKLDVVGNAPERDSQSEITVASLIRWLPSVGHEHLAENLQAGTSAPHPGSGEEIGTAEQRPLQRTLWRQTAILTKIREASFDPKALPKNLPGKPGVRAQVRNGLSKQDWPGKTFDRTWQALRDAKEIVDSS